MTQEDTVKDIVNKATIDGTQPALDQLFIKANAKKENVISEMRRYPNVAIDQRFDFVKRLHLLRNDTCREINNTAGEAISDLTWALNDQTYLSPEEEREYRFQEKLYRNRLENTVQSIEEHFQMFAEHLDLPTKRKLDAHEYEIEHIFDDLFGESGQSSQPPQATKEVKKDDDGYDFLFKP